MRALGGQRLAVLAAGMLFAFLLAAAVRAQSNDNSLRTDEPTPAPPRKPARPAPRDATPNRHAPLPRRFTDYEVWGDDVAAEAPSRNPLRQVQMTEELPAPAEPRALAPTPEQALREEEWASLGPQQGHPDDPWDTGPFAYPWFAHTDPNDPHRSIGWGEPLVGTSWRNRPWYVNPFIGGIFNGDLISGHVQQSNTAIGGARLGYDFDHYWGLEVRFAYSNPHLTEPDGTPLGVSRNYLTDIELLYYPWGDSRWRPYFTAGVGMATFRFTDDQNRVIHESLLSMPFGVGFKYYYSPWCSFRFDLVQNFASGSHTLDNQANMSLMAGVEFRFGGRRPSYFPWHGNTVGW